MYPKNFFAGMIVSFLGAFPPGMIDGITLSMSISNGARAALAFAAGTVIIEITYVRLSLFMMGKIQSKLDRIMAFRWIGPLVLTALAMSMFFSHDHRPLTVSLPAIPPFFIGLSLMAIDPLPIPFWIGWTIVLLSKKIVTPGPVAYWVYVFGVGSGSLLASCVYAFGGQFISELFTENQQRVGIIVGMILMAGAAVQIFQIMSEKLKTKGEKLRAPK